MSFACKAGNGNPVCEYKRNAKGTKMYEKLGLAVECAYTGECNNKLEVK